MDGLLLLDKPKGISSFFAAKKAAIYVGAKKFGYLGTLDPIATGLLPLFFGKATKSIKFFEKSDKEYRTDAESPTKGLPVELFLKPIDELEFSVRAHNCLIGAGIKRVIDLVNMTEDDILKIKNFGRKSLREVKEILAAFGLHLGMNIKELDLKKAIKEQEKAS